MTSATSRPTMIGPWRDLANVRGLGGCGHGAGEYAGVRLCQLLDSLLRAERDTA